VLTFPDATTTDDNDATNNTFLIHIVARVSNTAANHGFATATTLANSASLIYTDPTSGAASAPVTDAPPPALATVIEPRIATSKSLTPTSGVQGGDVLTYTVRFSNTGSSTISAAVGCNSTPGEIPCSSMPPAMQSTKPIHNSTIFMATSGWLHQPLHG